MLGRYLSYAASGGNDLGPEATQSPAMNPFEQDIYERLTAAGLTLDSQVGVSGYFIDFAARHPERPGEYVMAIEADGAAYHSSATARDRDRLRQEHLERLGWRFHRIWSTEWFRRREDEITRAVTAWRAAVALADQESAFESQRQSTPIQLTPAPAELVARAPKRTAAKPRIISGSPISDYSGAQLVDIVAWVNSDGLLRTDDELFEVVFKEMGYQVRGRRIKQRLYEAIGEVRRSEANQRDRLR
jgi:very-short-patch-repair endonuclease